MRSASIRCTQDGYASGNLSGVNIGDTGVVQARYTNGQSRTLGQIALANFSAPRSCSSSAIPAGPKPTNPGAAPRSRARHLQLGLIQSGALEGSNVDMTGELVSMITAQRNFRAHAQVITTADAITRTIINIR